MRMLLLGLLLVPAVAGAEARLALTRESEAGFRELIRLSQQGALGEDVVNLNARIQKDRVQLELKLRDGGARTLWLRPTSTEEKGTLGFFHLDAGQDATPADAERLRTLLARTFPSDPFLMENDGMDGTRISAPAPLGEALHNEGVQGAVTALGDHASGPWSRTGMLVTAIGSLLGLLLAIGVVLRTALRGN